jgi:pantothenate kinase
VVATATPEECVDRARQLAEQGGRRILGIAGPPGAGKSTLALRVVEALGGRARLVGMDGFHLSGGELDRLGRAERKGAPDTFDAAAYVALLRRLRASADTVHAPAFAREIEEPVPDAVTVPGDVALVVTEGNYLLVDEPPWSAVRELLDEAWYVHVPEDTRIERLVARHVAFGRSEAQARAWALGSDQDNAVLVAATRGRADLEVAQ